METSYKYIKNLEGTDYDYAQDHCYVKVSSHDTSGELSMVEDMLKPGFYLGRHHHKVMTEVFYILEGEIELIFDDSTLHAVPGDTITIPPNIWHAAKSEHGSKMLTIFKNGRFDLYLDELSKMTGEQFQDTELMKRIAAEHDIYEE